jgi:hypothetical protein
VVRARSGYCNVRGPNLLAGKPAEKQLELHAAGDAAGTLSAPIQLPFFYSGANRARVNVVMDIPSAALSPEKVNGKLHSEIDIIGLARGPDGTVAARFSDAVKLDFKDNDELRKFQEKPVHYENQFEIAPGAYTFTVVFTAGSRQFGKLERPLVIEPYDEKSLAIGSLAMGSDFRKTSAQSAALDTVLLEDRVPMVARGVRMIPAARYRFNAYQTAGVFAEIYEPGLTGEKPPVLGMQIRVFDAVTGELKDDSGVLGTAEYMRPGNPVVPVALKVPVNKLAPGSYRVELTAVDDSGGYARRSAAFEVW